MCVGVLRSLGRGGWLREACEVAGGNLLTVRGLHAVCRAVVVVAVQAPPATTKWRTELCFNGGT